MKKQDNSQVSTLTSSLTIAVLMTVFNRREGTLRCLRELKKQRLPEGVSIEVWMTDDGCTDGTAEAVAAAFPEVHIVQGTGNLFWNRGMIAAWRAAAEELKLRGKSEELRGGDTCYLWLNDDTELEEGAIERLIAAYRKSDGRSIIVGSCHAVGDKETFTYGGLKHGGTRILPDAEALKPCDTFNGNIVLIPQCVYEVCGTNDEYFHHGIGDFDYGYRAVKAGFSCLIAPGYYGACNRHERIAKWADASLPLAVRWRDFRSTLGAAPREMFVYHRRHWSLPYAIIKYISCHVHVLLPWLWKKEKVMNIKVKS